MPKDTISLTFHSRVPYTVTRDVRLQDGTVIKAVKVNVEHVYKDAKTRDKDDPTKVSRVYEIEAWNVDIPNADELDDEVINEICHYTDDFVLHLAHWLETPGHIAHRVSTEIRNDDNISL